MENEDKEQIMETDGDMEYADPDTAPVVSEVEPKPKKAALAVNSYWFPDTYRTIARYMTSKGISWTSVDPREVLGASYSSAQGYARIQSLVAPEPPTQSQGGCGVDAGSQGQTVAPQRQQGGCGV